MFWRAPDCRLPTREAAIFILSTACHEYAVGPSRPYQDFFCVCVCVCVCWLARGMRVKFTRTIHNGLIMVCEVENRGAPRILSASAIWKARNFIKQIKTDGYTHKIRSLELLRNEIKHRILSFEVFGLEKKNTNNKLNKQGTRRLPNGWNLVNSGCGVLSRSGFLQSDNDGWLSGLKIFVAYFVKVQSGNHCCSVERLPSDTTRCRHALFDK